MYSVPPRYRNSSPETNFFGLWLHSLRRYLTKLSVNPGLLFIDEFFHGCRRQMGRRTNHNGAIVLNIKGECLSSSLRSNDSVGERMIHRGSVKPSSSPSLLLSRRDGIGRNVFSPRKGLMIFGYWDG